MSDVHVVRLAAAQFNRVTRAQLLEAGLTPRGIQHRLASNRLVIVEQGVFAIPPVLAHDDWGRWMGATLTCAGSVLSHVSAAAAWEIWSRTRAFEIVTRPGSGGPVRHGGVLVFRSDRLAGDTTQLRRLPITTPERTLLDLAVSVSPRALARSVREALRLQLTSVDELADAIGRHPGRRGTRRLAITLSRYAGLPIERARSGAEVRALEVIRDAGLALPRLNVRIAGEEADLSWPAVQFIVEIDGGPFHLDVGEDARKEARWKTAGWTVRRVSADTVYDDPHRLLRALAEVNVARASP
jgi:very-short-patch-repair endonuclease